LARRGSNVVSSIIPKSLEWLTINCVVNDRKGVLFCFYIFRGEKLKDDYIKFYDPGTCMAMQKKKWMIIFLFKKIMSFFNKLVPARMSLGNQHLLILDGHGNHVTLKVI